MDIESKYNTALAALTLMHEQLEQVIAERDALLHEVETLRRIRHLALSFREAQIECMSSFASEPRMRLYHRALELDALLGIEPPDWRGRM